MRDFSNPSVRYQIAVGVANRLNIMRFLEKDPTASDEEIAERLGLGLSTVRYHRLAMRLKREKDDIPLPVTDFINLKKGYSTCQHSNS